MSNNIVSGEEFVVIEDPTTHIRYQFNATFLLSTYNCTWGRGCKGMTHVHEYGCCINGVTMDGDAEVNRVTAHVDQLTGDLWENKQRDWYEDREDDDLKNTLTVDGVCIFHNRGEDHHGCALWHYADQNGLDPDAVRPDACGFYPLVCEPLDDDGKFMLIGPIRRQGDNCMADEGNNWWCIDDPDNYDNAGMAWEQYYGTLVRMSSPEVMAQFAEYAEARVTLRRHPRDYGHPKPNGRPPETAGLHVTVPVTITKKP